MKYRHLVLPLLLGMAIPPPAAAEAGPAPREARPSAGVRLSRADYEDRVHAAWLGQIIGMEMAAPHEHRVASVVRLEDFPRSLEAARVDDDWYYEIVALRAFERYGIDLTVRELGRQWRENSAGTWGSSLEARVNLERGLDAPDTGHPRHNTMWWSIGPQFSAELYGMVAPGMPGVAGRLARELGAINGYAEGLDGAVFVAGMLSLAFVETDPREVVRGAARLIHPGSPYRQALDEVIALAEAGKGAREIAGRVEDRWHGEYPATNNAVANGALVAISVWFGGGDFLETINLAASLADFSDADCNAAGAAAVVGAMRGTRAIPSPLVAALGDRIVGATLGRVELTPPVDERISELARRTARIGEALLRSNGGAVDARDVVLPARAPVTQPLQAFSLPDLARFWDPAWTLERAGFGAGRGGMSGIRGQTFFRDGILATYPRDEVRGVLLRRDVTVGIGASLRARVGVDPGRAWQLDVYVDNEQVHGEIVEAPADSRGEIAWRDIRVDLGRFAGRTVHLRVYQRTLVPDRVPGKAYWAELRLDPEPPRPTAAVALP